ncbi:MAG: hypothetical protein Q3966_04280 [Neisseria sp.]|nr:hypothetical protein [Neisseria sp.]
MSISQQQGLRARRLRRGAFDDAAFAPYPKDEPQQPLYNLCDYFQ